MEQMDHLGVFEEVSHPQYGSPTLTSSSLSLSDAEIGLDRPAPLRGQHNRDVLRELGYDEERIDALIDDCVLTE